jgi:hypothetical protein
VIENSLQFAREPSAVPKMERRRVMLRERLGDNALFDKHLVPSELPIWQGRGRGRTMSAGAKIDHRAPRERRFVAV